MNALQDEKAALDHNPTGEGYARLAEKLKKLQSETAILPRILTVLGWTFRETQLFTTIISIIYQKMNGRE